MRFKHIPTGEILTVHDVKKKFGRQEPGRKAITIFPKDLSRWDDALMKQLELERVDD